MLVQMNLTEVDEDVARTWVGNGAQKLIQRAVTYTLGNEPSDAQFEQAKALFFIAYEKNIAVKTIVYPGCMRVLQTFSELNIPLACVTNKPRKFTPPFVREVTHGAFFFRH